MAETNKTHLHIGSNNIGGFIDIWPIPTAIQHGRLVATFCALHGYKKECRQMALQLYTVDILTVLLEV